MHLPEESAYEQPPTGTHNAMCIGFYDLGTQRSEYQGEVSNKHQVFLRWELIDETMEDGRPFTVGQFYTWSMSENAKLRAHLEAWRNKPFERADFGAGGFDTRNLLGKPCTLVIGANDKGKARVTSVGPKMKGVEAKPAENAALYVSLAPDRFDPAALAKLTDKMQEIVKRSPEFAKLSAPQDSGPDKAGTPFDDEIPF